MIIKTLKKRRLLIAVIMVLSLLASASYSVAMPLMMASMDSSECMASPCDMCCLMSQTAPQVGFSVSLLSLLESAPVNEPDSVPLPFYHPPG